MNSGSDASWLQLALSRAVLIRSLWCALIVGAILFAINHLDCCLVADRSSPVCVLKGLATATIPFMVSMVSSVLAIRRKDAKLVTAAVFRAFFSFHGGGVLA